MNNLLKSFFFYVLCLMMAFTTDAAPQSEFLLERIEKSSDLIAVVKVCNTKNSSSANLTINGSDYTCPSYQSSCELLAVLEGNDLTNQFINIVSWDCSELLIQADNLVPDEMLVVFLQELNDNLFVLSNYRQSIIPLSFYDDSYVARSTTLREKIGSLLTSNLAEQTQQQALDTLLWINRIKLDVPRKILTPTLNSTNIYVRALALEQLVRVKDTDAIEEGVNLLVESESINYQLASLSWSLEMAGITTQQANKLARSKVREISLAGMRVLRTKSDASSISLLVKQLENPDMEVQYAALVSLYHVAREIGPSLKEFHLHPKQKIEECKTMLNKRIILEHSN